MPCVDVDAVMALAGGETEGVDRAAVDLHLAECSRCRQLVAEAMRRTDENELDTTVPGVKARGRSLAAAAWKESALTGRTLGEFVLKDKIREGGFGVVYRAEQPILAREAVVKVLSTRHAGRDATVRRFLREARLASRLDHPYAAHMYAFGVEEDGLRWIAMEYVRGTPLDEWLTSHGPFRPRDFSPLLDRLADVIHSAHERGIVHRDIKPSNVMVLPRAGKLLPKLLDLGVAKLVDAPEPRAGAANGEQPQEPAAPAGPPSRTTAVVEREPAGLRMAEYVALTQEGTIIGSPGYMAPELFVDSAGADARSDLYALGVLCFEAVNGRRPFRGGSVTAVIEAHTHGPIPPSRVPELAAFFDKALAKAPGDRFATALELAADFRSAIGLGSSAEGLPKLDPAIRNAFLAHAFEPIAEAVAAADVAENAHQARDAVLELVSLVARLSAVLALSAWSRTASVRGSAESTAAEHLRALRRHELSDADWIALARALCRPFVDKLHSHPLPALVAWLCGGDELDRFDDLWRLRAEEASPGTDRQVREWLARRLPEVSHLLGSATFLLEHALVVRHNHRTECWNGQRSRRTPAVVSGSIPDDRAALLDSDGEPLLLLWPLVQAAAPTQGVPPELFVLEGPGRSGARLRSSSGFLLESPEVWDWLSAELLSSIGDESITGERGQAPYLGLAPFSIAEADRYFGREREVMECVNRLRVTPLVSVVGPSGAGKSSFVQAGLLPALAEEWRHVVFRPGPSPRAALAAALASPESRDGPVCIVVDQLEEVFTLSSDPEEKRAFAEALAECARNAADSIRVVLTLRDDFLMRAEALFGAGVLSAGLFLLGTPSRRELVRMITEPARRAGFRFEDPNLPEEMVDEVEDRPGALPLLSFAAAQLWAERDVHFRRLTRRAYQEMGGVTGALARHADVVVESMTHEQQRLVREALRHLTTAEGTRAVLSRADVVELLGPRGEEVLERLLAARLLTASEGTDADQIEIIHEALISAWPRLLEWRREDAEGARLRDELRAAARQWDGRGRARGLLWRDEALAELRAWRTRHQPSLTALEVSFANQSVAEAARIRRARRGLLITIVLGLCTAVAVLLWANARTRAAQREADASAARERAAAAADHRRFVNQLAEQGRKELLADEPLRALAYLGRARELGAGGFASDFLVAQAVAQSQAPLIQVPHAGVGVRARFSPDGAHFATAGYDGTVRVWDAKSGALLSTFHAEGGLRRFTFSPDGARILTSGRTGTVALWNARTGARELVLATGTPGLQWTTFSPDGTHVVTVNVDDSVRQWNATTGALEAVLGAGKEERVPLPGAAAYSADGSLLAVEQGQGAVRVWDARSRRPVALLRGHTANINVLEFAPEGSRLVVASDDGSASLWDARTGQRLHSFPHQASVMDASFSPSGKLIVTAGSDRTAVLWDAASGERLRTLRGHQGTVARALFGRDGTWIATASDDATVMLWDATSGQRLARWQGMQGVDAAGAKLLTMTEDSMATVWTAEPQVRLTPLIGHSSDVYRISFSPDGRRIITAGRDGTARLWDAVTGRALRVFRGHVGAIYSARMSPDGALIATTGGDGTVRVWSLDGECRAVLRGHTGLVREVAWHPNGKSLVSVGDDRTARIWSLDRQTAVVISTAKLTLAGVAFAPSGDRFATVGDERALRLWRTGDGRREASFELREPLQTIEFDRSGTRLLGAPAVPPLTVLAADSGKQLVELVGHVGSVEGAEWGAGDRLIATAGVDGTVRLWDSATGDLVQSLQVGSPLWSVAVSPDGRKLAFSGESSTPEVWTLPPAVPPGELARVLRCRVPFEVSADRIATRKLERSSCGVGVASP